jgi:hypothetical protein
MPIRKGVLRTPAGDHSSPLQTKVGHTMQKGNIIPKNGLILPFLSLVLQDPIEQLLIFHLAGCDGKTYAGDRLR